MIKLTKKELLEVDRIRKNLNDFETILFQEACIQAGIKYKL